MIYNEHKYISKFKNIKSNKISLLTAILWAFFLSCLFISNVYAQSEYTPIDAIIPFTCTKIEGRDNTSGSSTYKIKIKADNTDIPSPDRDEVIVDESGKGQFKIRINEPGTYVYRVFQEPGEDDKVKYDTTKYDIYVFVTTGKDGSLLYSVSVNIADTDKKPDKLEFKNVVSGSSTDTTTEQSTTSEQPTTTDQSTTTEQPTTAQQLLSSGAGSKRIVTGDETFILWASLALIVSFIGLICISIKKKERCD
ncbi:MAG: hypothetical protein K6B68_04955 [Eubacterium sp.]|nr:hypothetical protein [Eubacterium sp.]